MREPPLLNNLDFTPMTKVMNTCKDYVQFLRDRLENVSKQIIQIQTHQREQAERQLDRVKDPFRFKEGLMYIYLHPVQPLYILVH